MPLISHCLNSRFCCVFQEFFKEQIKKHEQTVTYIHQNVAAQDNILRALTETNADYANIRRATVDITQRYAINSRLEQTASSAPVFS
jgi:tyrosine-protein phosphatase non-receptor type 23